MQQRPENFNAAGGESEATLVAPRFDAEEARRAHPVVPLDEARPGAPFVSPRAHARGGVRRSWPPALIAVALLASAAVGGAVATKVFSGPQSDPAAVQAPAAQAPAQTAEAGPELRTRPEPPPAANAPREVADAPREVMDAPREVAATKPEARTPRVTRARRAEEAGVPARVEAARADAEDFEGEDEGRRGRGRGKRRERIEDDGEKEMRRVLKRAKEKAPRLVDVLVNPR